MTIAPTIGDLTDEQYEYADRIEVWLRRAAARALPADLIAYRAQVPAGDFPVVLAWMLAHQFVHTVTRRNIDGKTVTEFLPGAAPIHLG